MKYETFLSYIRQPFTSHQRKIAFYEEKKEERIEYLRQYYQNNKKRINEVRKRNYHNNKERHIECVKRYRQKNKQKCKEWSDNYQKDNKEKIAIQRKKYRQEHRAERKKYNKEWKRKNKEQTQRTSKEYYHNNREKIREYHAKYMQTKTRTDPKFRLNKNIRNSIYLSLKNKNISKNGRPWESLVNFTLEELMIHFESLFQSGMTWENQGKWHIDHIKPISLFNFESINDPEFKKCWELNNLQPLWAIDNIRKHNKYKVG